MMKTKKGLGFDAEPPETDVLAGAFGPEPDEDGNWPDIDKIVAPAPFKPVAASFMGPVAQAAHDIDVLLSIKSALVAADPANLSVSIATVPGLYPILGDDFRDDLIGLLNGRTELCIKAAKAKMRDLLADDA
jgi:hypothetical protein